MILAIDMGNTNIVLGGIDEKQTYFIERVTTDQGRTDTEYAIHFKNILEMHHIQLSDIEGAILSSVVPPLNTTILNAVEKAVGIRPLLVGSGMKTAVDLVAFRIVAHGGVVVEMLRVQAAKALAGINAPFPEIGFQHGTQRVKGIRHSCSFLLVY